MIDGLTFDEPTHTYRFKGEPVPNVTSILAPWADFSKVPRDLLERKRQIGTAVHKAIELDLADNLDYDQIDPVWAGYFGGWLNFKAQSGFVMEASEQKVFHKTLRYAGTLDLLGTLPKAGESLIDTKCCAILPRTAGPQTAAYRDAIGSPKLRRFALQLSADGSYKLVPLDDLNDLAVFKAALTIHNYMRIEK